MAVTYDKNTNYKALMEAAYQAGEYAAAAKYEQQRNAKIQDMNAAGGGTNPYGATVSTEYAQYLGGGYNPKGSHNDAGLSDAAMAAINNYKTQYNNAWSLNDQAGMDAAHAGAEAIRSAAGYSGGTDGSDYIASGGNAGGFAMSDISELMSQLQSSQPTYESKYSTQIDQMLNEILNREDFSYNAETDPLYQQYQKQYQREGQRAMNDTLASVASNAGGMNSYAVTAAQQANDYYNAQMTDKIPELYQLAYEMYLQNMDNEVQKLGILENADDRQYNRYRDTMSDWRNDLDFAYGMYRDDVADGQWQQQMDYNALRDAVADSQWDKTFDYNAGRDTVSDQQWREEFEHGKDQDSIANNRTDKNDAYNRAMEYIAMGVMPSADVLTAAGISSSEAQALLDKVQAEAATEESRWQYSNGAAKGDGGYVSTEKEATPTMKLSTAEDMANAGQFTDAVVKAFLDAGYTVDYLKETYGYGEVEPPDPGPGGVDDGNVSDRAKQIAKNLSMMTGQMGSEKAIANSIAIYVEDENLSDADARWLFGYFGYDPDEWLEAE